MAETTAVELYSDRIVQDIDEELCDRVADLRADGILPRLNIFTDNSTEASIKYVNMKMGAGARIGVSVTPQEYPALAPHRMGDCIRHAGEDPIVHGIIVQLPVAFGTNDHDEIKWRTNRLLANIPLEKDVDALRPESPFTPATPMSIERLLDGYEIDVIEGLVVVHGLGRLVGGPLLEILKARGAKNLVAVDGSTPLRDRRVALNDADVIITAVGKPGLLTPTMFDDHKRRRVLVDAGTAEQGGKVKGDVSPELREVAMDNGWIITPTKKGVGPLTVMMLLQNLVLAAENSRT